MNDMTPDDERAMKDMTPQEQARFLAGLDRAQEIRDKIGVTLKSDLPAWARIEQILDLDQEHDELARELERMVAPQSEPEAPQVDYAVLRLANTLMREQRKPNESEIAILLGCPPPTATEVALMELAERLAAKHGTVLPDFEAFHRWRWDFEGRGGTGDIID
jgi:hypothetical protein